MLCDHQHCLVPGHFITPEEHCISSDQLILISLSAPNIWQWLICFLSLWICPFWKFHRNVSFCVWLHSLSVFFSRFIHNVSCVCYFFWLRIVPLFHSSVFGYVDVTLTVHFACFYRKYRYHMICFFCKCKSRKQEYKTWGKIYFLFT